MEMELDFSFDNLDLSIPDIDMEFRNEKTDAKLDLAVLAAKFNKRQEHVKPCYAIDKKVHFKADNSVTAAWKNHRQIWIAKARKNSRFLVERTDIGEYFIFKTSADAHAFVSRMGAGYKEVAV